MTPDITAATQKAREIKARFGSLEPLCILKSMHNVVVISFADAAKRTGETRDAIISAFRDPCDAVSIYADHRYFVVYNQRMPFDVVRKALARELGHIVLGHDGTRPEDVRNQEAECFAKVLLEG